MFLANRVPPKVRDSYTKDAWAGSLAAVMVGLTVPFFAIIAREQLKASVFQISILTVAPMAGGVLSLYWAHLMEGRSTMAFAVRVWVFARALLLLTLFATGSWSFVTIVAAFWIISSAAGPAYSALMKEIYPDGERVRIMGYVRVCIVITVTLIAAIAGPLLKIVSYRYVFPVAAVFGVGSALWFGRIPTGAAVGSTSADFGRLVRDAVSVMREDHAFRWFCAGTFVYGAANFFAAPIFAIYQVDILHVDTRWASLYTVVGQIAAMGAFLYWGPYADKRKPVMIVIINSAIFSLTPVIYAMSTHAWMLLPTCVIAGITNAGLELSYFSGVLHYAPRDKVTLYQAIFASLIGVRGIIAPFIGAAVVQGGLMSMHAVFLVSFGIMLVGILVQVYGMRKWEKT